MISIAKAKKDSNIAEYLLYLWQMEDLLRAVDFDLNRLDEEVLVSIPEEAERKATRNWLTDLASQMKAQNIAVSGHHSETYEILNELAMLQQTLISVVKSAPFLKIYNSAKPYLDELRKKGEKVPKSDIETALTAMYGVLTLRLAKKEISPETLEATGQLSAYLRYLTRSYHQMRTGKMPE
jgi:hypothetical protein